MTGVPEMSGVGFKENFHQPHDAQTKIISFPPLGRSVGICGNLCHLRWDFSSSSLTIFLKEVGVGEFAGDDVIPSFTQAQLVSLSFNLYKELCSYKNCVCHLCFLQGRDRGRWLKAQLFA